MKRKRLKKFCTFFGGLRSLGALVLLLPFFIRNSVKCLGFLKVHRYALSILETAWKFYKIFPCRVPEFSMFYKKLACMHECSMENLPADSTRVFIFVLKKCFFSERLPKK